MKTFLIALKAFFYLVAALLFFGWVVLRVHRLDLILGVLPTWTEIPGITLVAAGGALLLLCFGVFVVRGRGTPLPFDPPTKLVALGPYKYVRNPIHVAWVTLFIGLGLYLRSPSILVFALAFFAVCYVYVLWVEEPSLKKRFRTEYEEYCKAVPRYVPRLDSSKKV
jgi:protein-S-isoprenylcysteine O-methyltransferase Ste14